MFQLNKSLEDWRRKLTNSNSLTKSDVDELESHLLDEIDALKEKGLTEEESFFVACGRIGSTDLLSNEFSKVNFNFIWLKKFLWLLSGYLIISFSQQLSGTLSCFLTATVSEITTLSSNGMTYLNLALNIIFSTLLLCLLFLPKYMLISSFQSKFNSLLVHKKWLLIIVFLLFIFMNTIGFTLLKGLLVRIIMTSQYGYLIAGEVGFTVIWSVILCLLFVILSFKSYGEQSKPI
jgi:hypothetical protein